MDQTCLQNFDNLAVKAILAGLHKTCVSVAHEKIKIWFLENRERKLEKLENEEIIEYFENYIDENVSSMFGSMHSL